MLVPSSDSKYLLSVMYHWNKIRMVWNKVRMLHCQVTKSVQWICARIKLTGVAVSESTST